MGDSFTDESSTVEPAEEVKETVTEESPVGTEEAEGTETPTDSSEETKPTDATEDGGSADTDEGKGDTDEKQKALGALRKEEENIDKNLSEIDLEIKRRKERITEKRAERRDKRDIIKTVDEVAPPTETDNLADIDKDTLAILERYTKAKGLVPKAELSHIKYEEEQKRQEKQFFKTNPEYLPENDKDDELYSELRKELALYAKPNDPEMLSRIYDKAHREVKARFSDRFKANVQKHVVAQKRVEISQSGGVSGGTSSKASESKFSEKQLSIMRNSGYSEEDIKDLEKYKK